MSNYWLREEATYTLDDLTELEIDDAQGFIDAEPGDSWRWEREEADGFWLLEEQSGEFTSGGAVAGGFSPTARVDVSPGGAVAGGTGPGVTVPVTPGGAVAGGYEPSEVYSGAPLARMSQMVVEVVYKPDAEMRVSQLAVEVIYANRTEDVWVAVID